VTVLLLNIQCQAINGNEIKDYISSIIKCVGETDTFLNDGPHIFFYLYGHH
jgi:hypothetical protein